MMLTRLGWLLLLRVVRWEHHSTINLFITTQPSVN